MGIVMRSVSPGGHWCLYSGQHTALFETAEGRRDRKESDVSGLSAGRPSTERPGWGARPGKGCQGMISASVVLSAAETLRQDHRVPMGESWFW